MWCNNSVFLLGKYFLKLTFVNFLTILWFKIEIWVSSHKLANICSTSLQSIRFYTRSQIFDKVTIFYPNIVVVLFLSLSKSHLKYHEYRIILFEACNASVRLMDLIQCWLKTLKMQQILHDTYVYMCVLCTILYK